MGLNQKLFQYQALGQESNAWDILRADTAWWALAFLQDIFGEKADVVYAVAQTSLHELLIQLRENGHISEAETTARMYLRSWIDRGWLRESEQMITRTDSTMVAIQFLNNIERRESTASASHLTAAQTMARDLAISLSPNIQERITLLSSQRDEIDRKIADLNAGHVETMTDAAHRESVRALHGQCYRLLQDFRLVESDMEEMDRSIRQRLLDSEGGRGVAVTARLEGERALSATDAGQAFNGFFDLLNDDVRSGEFSDQLASICQTTPEEMLTKDEKRLLRRLTAILTRESSRIFERRQTTNENLRRVIASGAFLEKQRIDHLIGDLERTAITLIEGGLSLRTDTGVSIAAGKTSRSHPLTIKPMWPEDHIDTSNVVPEVFDEDDIDPEVIRHLSGISVNEVARNIRELLNNEGPMSLLDISLHLPVTRGLEEVVAYLRVAHGVNAPVLEGRQDMYFSNIDGRRFMAHIYKYMLSGDLFPENIEDIGL